MANETIPLEGDGKPNKKGNVPAADVDFGKVAKDVAIAWNSKPEITLAWATVAQFTAETTEYNAKLALRMQAGGNRPQITQALFQIDTEMDDALAYVKGYILERYKKEAAPSYYSAFGIVHKTNKYVFPKDRNNRLASLELMLGGLIDHGFGDKDYGTNFWEDKKNKYETLLNEATNNDGNISIKVSSKNLLKEALKKKMNALINVLRANYPDSYKAELRAWGFQKEKY